MRDDSPTKRVFVLGAHLPNGGTYMIYHIGVMVYQHWAYEPVAVEVNPAAEAHSVWDYDVPFSKMTMAQMLQRATEEDVLISNPSFSDHMLGLTFPGKKLMYVQGFSTYRVLDGFFDKYVAVSPFVQRFLRDTYSMEVPVIQPFVHHEHVPHPLQPWEERPDGSVATILKRGGATLFQHFEAVLGQRYPELRYSVTVIPKRTPHRQVLRQLSRHRYFLWLSPLEGFGLPPLEAMLCGCAVVGFHTCGGLAYFEDKRNALVCPYPDFAQVVALFNTLVSNPSLAKTLLLPGVRTANTFTYDTFRQRWIDELTAFLGSPIAP